MAIFTNQATLTYNGVSLVSNVTTGQILDTLTVTKTTANENYSAGERITYTISLVNSGTAPYNGVTVSDDLGGFAEGEAQLYPLSYVEDSLLYYVNGVLQPAPGVTAGPPLSITGISVPAGGSAMLIYTAEVNEYAPLEAGSAITNTATASDAEGHTASDSETVNVTSGAILTIEKSLSPLTVTDNGEVNYTLTVYNYGNGEAGATENPVITDTFTPPLTGVTATYNGMLWTEGGEYTYSEETGVFTTSDGAITVPAATYTRDAATGAVTAVPGSVTVTVSGTLS